MVVYEEVQYFCRFSFDVNIFLLLSFSNFVCKEDFVLLVFIVLCIIFLIGSECYV